jgi:hypothetical protein
MISQTPSISFLLTTSPLSTSSFSSQLTFFPYSLSSLYTIHHCLINILRLLCVFFYLNHVIAHRVIYCLIQMQCVLQRSQVFQHISPFELCIIPLVSKCLLLGFQWSQLLINAYLIFFHYHLLFIRILSWCQWAFPFNLIII